MSAMGKRRSKKRNPLMQGGAVLIVFIGLSIYGALTRQSNPSNQQRVATVAATARPAATIEEIATQTPEAEVTEVQSVEEAPLALASNTRVPTSTQASATNRPAATAQPTAAQSEEVREVSPRTYYAVNQINVRACPSTTCEVVTRLSAGAAITVNGEAEGEAVSNGNTIWYRLDVNGDEGYVYSGLVSQNAPVNNTAIDTGSNQSQPVNPPAGAACPSTNYTCGSGLLTCEQAYACLAAGNGSLDNDGDGVPCESICPGG